MKAVTYQGIFNVKVKEVPEPIIKNAEDIIVKVTHASICGSDLHSYHGMVPSLEENYVLGHEAIGIVEETGREVSRLKKGDKVVLPFNIACGKCIYCQNQLESQCANVNNEGEIGACYGCSRLFGDYFGSQAEYVRVPFANFSPYKIPENNEIPDEQLVLLTDAIPSAFWGVQNGGVKKGDTVIVLGCGPIGLIAQKLAWINGAKRVIAVDRLDYRLEHSKIWNKTECFNFEKNEELPSLLLELTEGGADVVIDCVGMSGKMKPVEIVETALRLQGGALGAITFASQVIRKGGTVMLVGMYGSRYNTFPLGDFFTRNITLKMGIAPAIHSVPTLYRLLQTKQLDVSDIISHRLPLEEAEHAYSIFHKREENCLKIILQP
ncbi:alcohol dehydrogenase catalytic domain-containing protein [Neobacillus sp. LXY-4]|uniref:alcohol dehydrogenase catalytic domain-containing protein n=1 Tax=Neobacillus sp. LXY-4 TaxID=3379826 RepID=UPI003EDEEE53